MQPSMFGSNIVSDLSGLPEDLQLYILSFLRIREAKGLLRSNKVNARIMGQNSFWPN